MADSANRKINIWINDKQVVNSYKGITGAMRKARNELANMTIGSKEYLAQTKKLKQLQKIMDKHNMAQGRIARGWQKIKNEIKSIAAGNIIANAFTGITAKIGQAFNFITEKTGESEQGITNVLTLLSDADVDKYTESLKKGSLEVQKLGFAQTDTNKALFDAVSAGVKAGDSIDYLKEAAVLAKGGVTELGTATDGMTTIMNAYGLEMSEASKVAEGFFTAQKFGKTTVAELAANVGKVAPVANMANMSYQELLATTAELTKQGISTEEAMTDIKGALTALLKPGTEAEKIMRKFGIPVGATELKAAGFTKTMAKLNAVIKENPDLAAKIIPKIRGLSAVTALGGKHFEEYKDILNSVTTDIGKNSSLQKAYAKQMETLPNILAKAKGELTAMAVSLGEKLAPLIKKIIPLFSGMMKGIIQFIDFIVRNKEVLKIFFKILAVGTTALISYKLATKLSVLWTNRMRIATIKNMVQEKLQLVLTKGRRIATFALAAAQGLMTLNINKMRKALRLLNLTMKANPMGLLIAGITAAVVAYKLFIAESNKMTVAMKVEKELRKEVGKAIIREKTQIDLLLRVAKDEKRSKEERLQAIKKINKISPEYLGNITLEKINTDETTVAVKNYIKALEDKTRAQIAQKKLAEINGKIFDIEIKRAEYLARIERNSIASGVVLTDEQQKIVDHSVKVETDGYTKKIAKLNDYKDEYLKILDKLNVNLIGSGGETSTSKLTPTITPTITQTGNGKGIKKAEDLYKKYLSIYENYVKEVDSLNKKLNLQNKTSWENELTSAADHYNDMIAVTNAAIDDLEAKGKKRTPKETELLKKFYQQQIDITIMYENQNADIHKRMQEKIDNTLMTSQEREIKAVKDKYKDQLAFAKRYSDEYTALVEQMNAEIKAINDKYAKDPEKKDLFGLTDKQWDEIQNKVSLVKSYAEQLSEIWGAYNEARRNEEEAHMQRVENNAERRKNILQQRLDFGLISETEYANRTKKIDQDVDLQKKKIARDQAIREKKLNTFSAIIDTASAVIGMLADPGGIPGIALGVLAGITGAAQIAAIQSQPIPAFAGGGRINKPTVGLMGEAGKEILLSNSVVDDPTYGPIADDLARIQEGKQPNFIGEPAKPNFGGMQKAISSSGNIFNSSNTVINQIDSKGMFAMNSNITDMSADIKEMTKTVSDLKYLKAIITQKELNERDTDEELLLRYSQF